MVASRTCSTAFAEAARVTAEVPVLAANPADAVRTLHVTMAAMARTVRFMVRSGSLESGWTTTSSLVETWFAPRQRGCARGRAQVPGRRDVATQGDVKWRAHRGGGRSRSCRLRARGGVCLRRARSRSGAAPGQRPGAAGPGCRWPRRGACATRADRGPLAPGGPAKRRSSAGAPAHRAARAAGPRAAARDTALEPVAAGAALAAPAPHPRAPRVRAPLLPGDERRHDPRRAGAEARGAGLGLARPRAAGAVGAAADHPLLHHRPRVHPPAPGPRSGAARRACLRPVGPGALAAPDRRAT